MEDIREMQGGLHQKTQSTLARNSCLFDKRKASYCLAGFFHDLIELILGTELLQAVDQI
jgi:hypothetical protein